MYLKLVLRNAKRTMKDYLIYIVTMTLCVMLFYAFLSISSKFYHPNIGVEFNLTMVNKGMKFAISMITLLLVFLIYYVNDYMLRRRQKEFAIQTIIGMELSTTAWLFFAETFFMGIAAMIFGIMLGMFCSQFITAMLLTSFEQPFKLSWMLFPDTVCFTLIFFSAIFVLVGIWNVYTIKKIKIIDMLLAEKRNDGSIKKSLWMVISIIVYELALAEMTWNGIKIKHYYFDSRYQLPVHIMFWGNILLPAAAVFISILWLIRRKRWKKESFIVVLMIFSIFNAVFAAMIPWQKMKYFLPYDSGVYNQYLLFLLIDLWFAVCALFYSLSNIFMAWKEKSLKWKYNRENLFLFGQILSKLKTTTKTMTLICLTLVLSVFLFMAIPALSDWAFGYLKARAVYDIAMNANYHGVYEKEELPNKENYDFITDCMKEYKIKPIYDNIFNLYLPKEEEFYQRVKWEFPVLAISLSDYNSLLTMLGHETISLKENEFTTQWQSIAAKEERTQFLRDHSTVSTDAGTLSLAEEQCYDIAMGEHLYNAYTDVIYVFPDNICKKLLSVIRNRYIKTEQAISYNTAKKIEAAFEKQYLQERNSNYYIRTRTSEVNDTKGSIFIMQASISYAAVVLLVICFTILSLQQLLDAVYYQYRFGVLQKLGVDDERMNGLILKQLAIWFGLPIVIAGIISFILVFYFFQMISAQISAYVGFGVLMTQVAIIALILLFLLLCYFTSTWILFKYSIKKI